MFSLQLGYTIFLGLCLQRLCALSSPLRTFTNYTYSTELQTGLADLWWSIDNVRKEITFELHMNTTGWIALGISPAGGMKNADIGLGWVDATGRLHFEDRFATGPSQPLVDSTTSDWIGMNGREENGWTAIQFRRLLDTCDSMDVPIKSGTNILIYAYSTDDPEMINGQATISYHGTQRRFTRIVPLQSYGNPPAERKFVGLDYIDFRLNDYKIPDSETTYHCKVYKAPTNIRERRHAIAYKTLVDPRNLDLVHHLLTYECNPEAVFDDNNLPDGLCDDLIDQINPCSANIANGWAIGADEILEYPDVAGYPFGGDFEVKYYMVQMHYDNPQRMNNRSDSSGIRFYLGSELRKHELGFLSLGAEATVLGITIPPRMDQFIIDSYCPSEGTKRFPKEGITVFSSFPHTHLQGRSLWTKIIRNRTAVQYLFNAETYDFNYQFTNTLQKPIKLFPGDELATRCIYSTTNKKQVTVGGEATKDEMCLHMFSYYPRMKNMYVCFTQNPVIGWGSVANTSAPTWDFNTTRRWVMERNWTTENSAEWQKFYMNAPRWAYAGKANDFELTLLPEPPVYKDLTLDTCENIIFNGGYRQQPMIILLSYIYFVNAILSSS